MTDDITRGLGLLADEAEPATIDAQHVITRARVRTRNRRATLATAFATVAMVGALVVAMNPLTQSDQGATITDTTLEGRLNRLLTEALPDLIPAGWSLVPDRPAGPMPDLEFVCVDSNVNGCSTGATYNDGVGDVDISISVNRIPRNFTEFCDPQFCDPGDLFVQDNLPDGTRTQVRTYSEKPTSRDFLQLLVTRPDGTQVDVVAIWPHDTRSEPPLSTDEILKFATVFSYDSTLPVGAPLNKPTEEFVSDDPKRGARVTQELTDVLDEVIPAGWTKAPDTEQPVQPAFTFECSGSMVGPGTDAPTVESCWAAVYYQDATGVIAFKLSVSPVEVFEINCDAGCAEKTLSDGTETRVSQEFVEQIAEYEHTLAATRPDGTHIWVQVYWKEQRPKTPLTDDELLKFATAFTF